MIVMQGTPPIIVSQQFEAWAYRGVIAVLFYVVGWMMVERIKHQNKIWGVVQDNKKNSEIALAEARKEFTTALKETMQNFSGSLGQLNTTVKEVGDTLRALQLTIGKEYATRVELRDLRDELKQEIRDKDS